VLLPKTLNSQMSKVGAGALAPDAAVAGGSSGAEAQIP
jgi:hypothetical protein